MSMDSFNPLDVLREEMESEEIYLRVNAVHRMRVVTTLLAADKIKSQLIPYIDQLIKKEEDEVLFALAEELGNIAQMMPNQPLTVLPQLEMLAGFDETVVREQAIVSIIKICAMISDADLNSQIIPMLFRLANNEANFTCRVSAVNLMCPLYPRAGNQKEKIRQKFTELCNEETPMVRRAVAIKIGEIAQFMDKGHVINDLIPIQKQLCQDEQDQVRLLCMESLKNMAKILNTSENKTNTLPLIIQAAEDKSWRVRLALSKIFAEVIQIDISELSEAEGKELADSSLIQIFSNLLKDQESDVRVVAVQSLAKFIRFVSPEKLQLIVPQLQILCRDSMAHVKSYVTEVVGVIVTLLPKEYAQTKLGSYLLEMMNDENSDVRKGAAKAAGKFAEAVGIDGLNQFAPALKQGMEDPKWRVRKEIINSIITLALSLKNQEIYNKYLEQSYLMFMRDRASEVRTIGLEKLPEILQVYKSDQMLASLISKITENLSKDKGHVFRGTALYAIQQVGLVAPSEIILEKLLPLVIKNLKDPVPNIKFIAIKVAKSLQKRIEYPAAVNQIKQAISELQNDPDRDVAFYANEALSY